MKLYIKVILTIFLIIIYIYVCNITMLPSSIILIQGETIELNTVLGLGIRSKETMQTSSNLNTKLTDQVGKQDLEISLFNTIPVKDVTVNVIPKTTVIPLGKAIGMKMYTEGVLVVGMSEIEGLSLFAKTPSGCGTSPR